MSKVLGDDNSYLIKLAPDSLWLPLLEDIIPSLVSAVTGKRNGFKSFIESRQTRLKFVPVVSTEPHIFRISKSHSLTWLRCPQTPNHGLSQHCSSEQRPLPVQLGPSALPQTSWASFFVPLAQTLFRTSPCPECAPWSSTRTNRIDKQISWEPFILFIIIFITLGMSLMKHLVFQLMQAFWQLCTILKQKEASLI